MFDEQKSLLDTILKKKKVKVQGQEVYQYLVYKVFFDALSSAYPLFYKKVDKKKFEKAVLEFMRFGLSGIEMWRMPNEFRKFVKNRKLFREMTYTDELLWFEWSEVELMMKNYKPNKTQEFSYNNEYELSKSSVLKKLNHKVFERDSFDEKGEFYLLGFYDFENYRVVYTEVSSLLYVFLKKMDKKGLNKAVKYISKMSEQNQKDVKKFFRETLEDLSLKKILDLS